MNRIFGWKRGFQSSLTLSLSLACSVALAQSAPSVVPLHSLLRASGEAMQPVNAKYVGPGSCSAGACHGEIQAMHLTRVLQNEYSTWVTADKHAQAYTSLTGLLGRQIASTLKIGPAENAPRCLVCHALSVSPAEHAREFDVRDGVSCESCHGPASLWLGPHIQPTAAHAKMVELGLFDNRNLKLRAEKCLSCHLGAAGMSVDHELIAAGHPVLTFELDSFTAVEPPHWVEKTQDPLAGVKIWAAGQAVELRESMLQISRRAASGPWPEFSEMDCIACHHALTGPQSWRQKEGYSGRRPGDPSYDRSHYVLFRHFADELDPELNRELRTEVAKVNSLVSTMSTDRAAVQAAANRAAELAGQLTAEVQSASYDTARTNRLLASITNDADSIAADGERTAEQATMTVDSLYIARAKAAGPNAAARDAIDSLFKLVNNPSAYNAPQFAAGMKRAGAALR